MRGTEHQLARPLWGWRRFGGWLIGVVLLLGTVMLVLHLADLERTARLMQQAKPGWMALALGLQAATYALTAFIWHDALRAQGERVARRALLPLSVAKLFAEQAVPSGGVSGAAFFVAALGRRGIDSAHCLGALLASLISGYAAYVLMASVALAALAVQHRLSHWIVVSAVLFLVFVSAIVALAASLRWLDRLPPATVVQRLPMVKLLIDALAEAPSDIWRAGLIARLGGLQLLILVCDAVTLWACLHAIGANTGAAASLAAFMVASMVATIGFVPLGLGTFEAACTATLAHQGVPLAAALTATLILRALTLWLPMLPGLWLMRGVLGGTTDDADP